MATLTKTETGKKVVYTITNDQGQVYIYTVYKEPLYHIEHSGPWPANGVQNWQTYCFQIENSLP